jgi:hypothetical protein
MDDSSRLQVAGKILGAEEAAELGSAWGSSTSLRPGSRMRPSPHEQNDSRQIALAAVD